MPTESNSSISTLLKFGGPLLKAFGHAESGRAAKLAGERARVSAEFDAWQAKREALLAIAIGQRQAMEERRRGRILASRAIAVAAASGGGVTDATIINLITRTQGEAAYRAGVALYEGEARARTLRLQAAASQIAGSQAVAEGRRAQTGQLLAGGAELGRAYYRYRRDRGEGESLLAKYGGGGPGGDAGLIGTYEADFT